MYPFYHETKDQFLFSFIQKPEVNYSVEFQVGFLGLAGGRGENMRRRGFITKCNTEPKHARAGQLWEAMA